MGLLWGVAFHWVDVVAARRRSTWSARSGRRSASTATSPTELRGARAGQGDARDARLHDRCRGPLTQWVTDHRKHHALSDKEGDPHSPHVGHGEAAWGAFTRLRPRARRLDVLEHGHGAGPRVREGSLRGPAAPRRSTGSTCSGSSSRSASRSRSATSSAATARPGVEGLVWGGLIRIFLYQHATFA